MPPAKDTKAPLLSPQQALLQIMLTVAAVDEPPKDAELEHIERLINSLPVFANLERSAIPIALEQFATLMENNEGLETMLTLAAQALPKGLYETAYALAVEMTAADMQVQPEEIRFLTLLRDTLQLDKLTVAALERGIRARFMRTTNTEK